MEQDFFFFSDNQKITSHLSSLSLYIANYIIVVCLSSFIFSQTEPDNMQNPSYWHDMKMEYWYFIHNYF